MAKTLPTQDAALWRAVLGASRTAAETSRAKRITNHLLSEHNPADASTYVLLANSYADAGDLMESGKVRESMIERKIKKIPRMTWVTINGVTHTFVANDRSHPLIHLCIEIGKIENSNEEGGLHCASKVGTTG